MAQAVQGASVNLAGTNIVNFRLTETFPPMSPFAGLIGQPGVQTTPPLSRGYLTDSAINLSNFNLSRVCDFKFIFNFNLVLGALTLPFNEILGAIKNAKLRAAAIIRASLNMLIRPLRVAINAILSALSLDATGIFSLSISVAKDILRKIRALTKQIAQIIEDVYVYVALVQDIIAIVNWIKTLPDRIKEIVQTCIANFQNSIQNTINQVKSIPGQFTGQAQTIANNVTSNFNMTMASLKQTADAATKGSNSNISAIINGSTSSSDLDAMKLFITQNTPTANATQSQTTSYAVSNSTSP